MADWAIMDKESIIFDGDEDEMRSLFELFPEGHAWKEFFKQKGKIEGDLLLIQIHGRKH